MNINTGVVLQWLWQIHMESLNTISSVVFLAVAAEPVS